MNTLGCFSWLHSWGFFAFFQYAVFLFHAWKAIDFFLHSQKISLYLWYERSSSYRVDWNFWIRVMAFLLGGWRRSAWLHPACFLLSSLLMGFHETVLVRCCGTKCAQRCLRVRSPDSPCSQAPSSASLCLVLALILIPPKSWFQQLLCQRALTLGSTLHALKTHIRLSNPTCSERWWAPDRAPEEEGRKEGIGVISSIPNESLTHSSCSLLSLWLLTSW